MKLFQASRLSGACSTPARHGGILLDDTTDVLLLKCTRGNHWTICHKRHQPLGDTRNPPTVSCLHLSAYGQIRHRIGTACRLHTGDRNPTSTSSHPIHSTPTLADPGLTPT